MKENSCGILPEKHQGSEEEQQAMTVIFLTFFLLSRYEAKRLEIEAWMQRMENRADRMGSVATTADVLDAQQKEQKVRAIFSIIYFIASLYSF